MYFYLSISTFVISSVPMTCFNHFSTCIFAGHELAYAIKLNQLRELGGKRDQEGLTEAEVAAIMEEMTAANNNNNNRKHEFFLKHKKSQKRQSIGE